MRLFKKTFMVLALAAAFSMVLPAVGTSAETAAASTNVYYTDSGIVDGYHRLVINTGSGNITTAVNKAALAAKSGATDSVKYMIVIPSGSYTISKAIYLYSNTYLYADGAYVKRPGGGPMLRNGTTKSGGGYSGDRNITIDGGTWNGDAKHAKKNFSIAKFAHGKNFVLKNLTLTNDAGAHHVEFGGINGIRITNCRFTNLYRLKGKKSTVGQEAVQFDITNKTGFVGYTPYDDTVYM
ncbi:MAG: hypothetical protein VB031_00290 [Eubacteriaceae bacterium]|nr:hypothetical protein [Eubacteriaceae bacterium]